MTEVRIHPTALVEEGVEIGAGTSVWDNVHLRGPSRIGRDCIIGGKTIISYGVMIGDRVKINSMVYIPTGVTIEIGAIISAGTIFANDRYPRATTPDLATLRGSTPDGYTLETMVRAGATIGAGCRIGPGLEISAFAMIRMGAVVTRDVPAFALVTGAPATVAGFVCKCGEPLAKGRPETLPEGRVTCGTCGRDYSLAGGTCAPTELETA